MTMTNQAADLALVGEDGSARSDAARALGLSVAEAAQAIRIASIPKQNRDGLMDLPTEELAAIGKMYTGELITKA